jgi:hypothetical protein
VPGLSDGIRVISIVDRYLEHASVFVFDNAGEPEYLLGSSDWMPRNLDIASRPPSMGRRALRASAHSITSAARNRTRRCQLVT